MQRLEQSTREHKEKLRAQQEKYREMEKQMEQEMKKQMEDLKTANIENSKKIVEQMKENYE